MEPDPPELIYDGSCPYCRSVASMVSAADIRNQFRLTDIESERGRELVTDHWDEFVHSPHLFTESYVYYGVGPVAKGVFRKLLSPR
jgi:predicted DCC family thiol-disulfide oxidoreductase YuxK